MVRWPGGQVVRVIRVVSLVICFQNINGFHDLNHPIIEKSTDIRPVHRQTHRKWKVEQYAV